MSEQPQKVVVYYRVSTKSQGESGLGLEAQEALVKSWLGSRQIVGEYMEIESGRKINRVELKRAIDHARQDGAILAVAKLDRLARNVAFLAAILESGIEIIACDNPHANRTMLQMIAVFAEYEARQISERTKAALQVARQRGKKLGGWRRKDLKPRKFTRAEQRRGGRKGGKGKTGKYKFINADAEAIIKRMKRQGFTYKQIAKYMEKAGFGTFTIRYLCTIVYRPDTPGARRTVKRFNPRPAEEIGAEAMTQALGG